jgi:hypothetical protein
MKVHEIYNVPKIFYPRQNYTLYLSLLGVLG